MPVFALVDCNNFYVSCERVFNPCLVDKPVIVLSNNDGCAVARSNEAKALGIGMATPFFKIKTIVEHHGVCVLSSNYALYGGHVQPGNCRPWPGSALPWKSIPLMRHFLI